MTCRRWLFALFLAGFYVPMAEAQSLKYPPAKRGDLVETLHGKEVPDPYRWLEDDVRKSAEVKQWVEAQSKLTQDYLAAIPERETIQNKLTSLWNYEKVTAPSKVAGRYFFRKNDGLQNQSVLYSMDKFGGEARVLLDPNQWTKDGTIALGGTSVSDSGRYMAYSVSEAGSDWQTLKVLDVDTGKPMGDEIKWVKFSSPSWTPDGKGFFYGRYPEPAKEAQFQSLNKNQMVMYHRVGTPQADDVLVYKRPDQPDWGFTTAVTEDGRYLVITTWVGTDHRYRVTYRDLAEPYAMPIDLIDKFENDYTLIDSDGPVMFFKTDYEAPRGRVIAIDIRKPAKADWKEIIPQAAESLEGVSVVGNLLVANYLKDAKSQIKLYTPTGEFVREVQLPGIGAAAGFAGRKADLETFYTFSSYAVPPTTFRYDVITGKSTVFRESKVAFDSTKYETKQVFVTSKDGTKVPMFITAKKGLELNGENPTLLYAYGGFNISLTPAFSPGVVGWLEMGGVYCVANLRGGGEYGQEWHKAGTKSKKQNVFDDFISSAEYLIKEKYTSKEKLAVKGGSNGGLLIGAVMTQRPDLFGACLPHVGVMDMLRFHKFTAGRFWVDDYGSPDKAEDFPALFAYSPYHNIKKGVQYPPTMVITADTDDRVVPGHSFKFAANLQFSHTGDAPVLARIETKAGHGAGKPTSKIIEELADEYAFLFKNLKMKK